MEDETEPVHGLHRLLVFYDMCGIQEYNTVGKPVQRFLPRWNKATVPGPEWAPMVGLT